jgi:hypothetical protein
MRISQAKRPIAVVFLPTKKLILKVELNTFLLHTFSIDEKVCKKSRQKYASTLMA